MSGPSRGCCSTGRPRSGVLLGYVIAALRTVAPGVGESALAHLQAPQPAPIQTVLTTLLNDLGAIAGDIVLVLDDCHVIDGLEGQEGQVFLLLQTSILGRMTGPRCDAVTGQGGGKAMLEALDRGNMFLVPLDDRRRWYRYHHLFADVLHARLLDEQPDDVVDLHRRASVWYEQNGEPSVTAVGAIGHAQVCRAVPNADLWRVSQNYAEVRVMPNSEWKPVRGLGLVALRSA